VALVVGAQIHAALKHRQGAVRGLVRVMSYVGRRLLPRRSGGVGICGDAVTEFGIRINKNQFQNFW